MCQQQSLAEYQLIQWVEMFFDLFFRVFCMIDIFAWLQFAGTAL
jgi:hypothetical protein